MRHFEKLWYEKFPRHIRKKLPKVPFKSYSSYKNDSKDMSPGGKIDLMQLY